ncbi:MULTISPECIES: hypothetical protein [Arthrobacter]|uniref:Uncharacterized protein n=1 Tax=Arthrobacter terricola TaxID=2547396 RepID=A0A4R5KAY4_9MICC|nr:MULTISPECIES: hypothetical protein [Arthrobacter]MBT8162911.1 hypothetical protein [Arthrobacter sp. GN70]TDF91675.1 hypothetical protein E1809_20370 [Arthrobacter terricola]
MAEPTPYDTGARCEPKPWLPTSDVQQLALRNDLPDDFGKVDFDNDEGGTVCVAYVERNGDGRFTVHIQPLVDEELRVMVHRDDGSVVILPGPASSATEKDS